MSECLLLLVISAILSFENKYVLVIHKLTNHGKFYEIKKFDFFFLFNILDLCAGLIINFFLLFLFYISHKFKLVSSALKRLIQWIKMYLQNFQCLYVADYERFSCIRKVFRISKASEKNLLVLRKYFSILFKISRILKINEYTGRVKEWKKMLWLFQLYHFKNLCLVMEVFLFIRKKLLKIFSKSFKLYK